MEVEVLVVDFSNQRHCENVVRLMDEYARDPAGGGCPLPDAIKAKLAGELAKRPHALSILCYVDGQPAGLANCFFGFSTFKRKPLINIHDFVVAQDFRRNGIGQKMLAKIEALARECGCCKITLEVLERNEPAKGAYVKAGFVGYELDPEFGRALFWEKEL